MLGSGAAAISEAGFVAGSFGYEFVDDDATVWNLGLPTLGTFTDSNGDGILDLPSRCPFLRLTATSRAGPST